MKKLPYIEAQIYIMFIKEDKTYVAYSPALDLSTCGDTIDQAKKMFLEQVEVFFDELREKGTTEQVLTSLGWKKQKRSNRFVPPVVVESSLQSVRVPFAV